MTDSIDVTPTTPLILPPLKDYIRDTSVLQRIHDLHEFSFAVSYQRNGALAAKTVRQALVTEGFAALNELLTEVGVHQLHELDSKQQRRTTNRLAPNDPVVRFEFNDDIYGCVVEFYQDRFKMTRYDSSFADFYEWYKVIMPRVSALEMTLRGIVDSKWKHLLIPVRSAYTFDFYFGKFHRADKRVKQNTHVLAALIPRMPGPDGALIPLAEHEFYRVDLNVSMRDSLAGRSREIWYTLEAPFNKNGHFIQFRAQLRNESLPVLEKGEVRTVEPFDGVIGGDYDLAILSFLRDRAVERYLRALFGDWDFETVRKL